MEKNKKSGRKLRKTLFRLFIFVFIVLLTAACAYYSYKYVIEFNTQAAQKDIQTSISPEAGISVEIPLGSSTSAIAGILETKGIVKYPFVFKALSKLNGYDNLYKSGTHVLEKGIDYNSLKGYDKIMGILSSKPLDNPSINVTIPEGYTFKQTMDVFAAKKIINKDKFTQVANNEKFDYDFIKSIPKRDNRLEGYLFPETYTFNTKGGEGEIIKKMLDQFQKVFSDSYKKRAKELNMSIDQVITLASIIEREASQPEEREIISGVFHNRLKSKDKTLNKLQSCATLQYILLKKDGKIKENLTLDDEKIDDPYNTYIHAGLPPGPICSPGVESIAAALYPKEHDYLYFVLKEDGTGTHYFSRTYKEHVNAQNKAQAQKAQTDKK